MPCIDDGRVCGGYSKRSVNIWLRDPDGITKRHGIELYKTRKEAQVGMIQKRNKRDVKMEMDWKADERMHGEGVEWRVKCY
jgi:hypothetical protein